MVRNAIADTAVIAFTVASLAVVTAKGEELGKAQLELIKEVQSSLQKGNN